MSAINLTEARIRALPFGSGIHRDEQVRGLMVVCHKTTKTYAAQGDVRRNGRHVRTVRVKIDRVDRIGLREARRRAREIMSTIQSGIDPTAGPKETGITLEAALEAHLAERELRPATVQGYTYDLSRYLKSLRRRAVADITRQDCRELLETLTKRHGRTAGSSGLRMLRCIINTAMRIDETILRNPTDAVRIPIPGQRRVEPLNIAKWWHLTGELPPIRRDLYRAFLLTDARKASLLLVRRDDVDLAARTMTFTHLKTHGRLIFPMGEFLAGMVAMRMCDDEPLRSEWLWPSHRSAKGHVTQPREEKRLSTSPHALRHHARTLMIAAGVPYAESALLLGQKLPGASGGYVHPEHLVEALRPHAQALEGFILDKVQKQTFFYVPAFRSES